MVHNHLPTAKNNGLAPITAATGDNPGLSIFRIFGCDAYAARPADQVKGLEHRSILGKYVGYYPESQTHMVLLPRNDGGAPPSLQPCVTKQEDALPKRVRNRLVKAKHVVFDDKKAPNTVKGGTVPIEWPAYQPFDDDDDNTVIDEIKYTQTVYPQARSRHMTVVTRQPSMSITTGLIVHAVRSVANATNLTQIDCTHVPESTNKE